MTIAVDLGRKATKQTNIPIIENSGKQNSKKIRKVEINQFCDGLRNTMINYDAFNKI